MSGFSQKEKGKTYKFRIQRKSSFYYLHEVLSTIYMKSYLNLIYPQGTLRGLSRRVWNHIIALNVQLRKFVLDLGGDRNSSESI